MLTINYHIQLSGAGMDKGNFSPDPANATVITDGNTQNGGQLVQTNYPTTGNDFLSRISGIVFELQPANTNYLMKLQGLAYRHRNGCSPLLRDHAGPDH